MAEENKIRDAADAIKGIVEAVPVYQDVLQPAAKEVGTALQTIAKTLHIILSPISSLVWGYDKIKEFVENTVSEKLKNVPNEELCPPKPNVAGPTLEALRYTGYQESLRDLYANLLATAIHTKTASQAHPAFVEIIRQMSPDEALIVNILFKKVSAPKIDVRIEEKNSKIGHWSHRNFSLLASEAGCSSPELGSSYLVNLARLGIVELRETYRLQGENGENLYQPLINSKEIAMFLAAFEKSEHQKTAIDYGAVILTKLGEQFCFACIAGDTH